MSPRHLALSFVVLVNVGCAGPDPAKLFPPGKPTSAEVAGGIPMNRYRDSVLGFQVLRPEGLEVVRLNERCTDSIPELLFRSDWSDEGGPAIAVALTRVSRSAAADAERIDSTSSGWESVGRRILTQELAIAAGPGWMLLSGNRYVGVAMEGGGMATDEEKVKFATAERGDGCRLVIFFNLPAASLGDRITDWEMMESLRFLSTPAEAETSTSLDSLPLARRIGVVENNITNGCLTIDNVTIRPGTAMTLLSFDDDQRVVGYGAITLDPMKWCVDSTAAVPRTGYMVGIERPHDYTRIDRSIAILGVARPDTTGNAIRIDVDHDGRPDRVGICSVDDASSWAWVIAEQPRVRLLWKRRLEKLRIGVSWPRCSAALLDFLK